MLRIGNYCSFGTHWMQRIQSYCIFGTNWVVVSGHTGCKGIYTFVVLGHTECKGLVGYNSSICKLFGFLRFQRKDCIGPFQRSGRKRLYNMELHM